MIKIIRYKLYKWRLNFINNKRIKKNQLPICDTKGYPYTPSNYKDVPSVGLPKPIGKLIYLNQNNDEKTNHNKNNVNPE